MAGEFNSKSIRSAIASTVGFMVGPTSVVSAPIGLFMPALIAEFHIGRFLFALFMMCAATMAATIAALSGAVMDRIGVRWVAIFGVCLLGAAEMLLSQARGSVWVLFTFNLTVGIAAGIQSPVAYSKMISLWFHRRRGMVLSLAGAIGASFGTLLTLHVADKAIRSFGWRGGYIALGTFVLVVGLPVLLLFLREPAGARKSTKAEAAAATANLPGLTVRQAVRQPAYLIVMVSLFLAVGALVSMGINGPSLMTSRGMGDIRSLFLSMIALGSLVGQLSAAFLLDRFNTPKVGIPYILLAFIGAVIVVNWGFSPHVVLPASFLMGFGQGAEIGLSAYYVSRYCGLKAFGALFGVIYGVTVAGAGGGPVIAGLLFDKFGGDGPLYLAIQVALGLAVIGIVSLPKYAFDVHRGPGELIEEASDAKDPVAV